MCNSVANMLALKDAVINNTEPPDGISVFKLDRDAIRRYETELKEFAQQKELYASGQNSKDILLPCGCIIRAYKDGNNGADSGKKLELIQVINGQAHETITLNARKDFYDFCDYAQKGSGGQYFGNIDKIFGIGIYGFLEYNREQVEKYVQKQLKEAKQTGILTEDGILKKPKKIKIKRKGVLLPQPIQFNFMPILQVHDRDYFLPINGKQNRGSERGIECYPSTLLHQLKCLGFINPLLTREDIELRYTDLWSKTSVLNENINNRRLETLWLRHICENKNFRFIRDKLSRKYSDVPNDVITTVNNQYIIVQLFLTQIKQKRELGMIDDVKNLYQQTLDVNHPYYILKQLIHQNLTLEFPCKTYEDETGIKTFDGCWFNNNQTLGLCAFGEYYKYIRDWWYGMHMSLTNAVLPNIKKTDWAKLAGADQCSFRVYEYRQDYKIGTNNRIDKDLTDHLKNGWAVTILVKDNHYVTFRDATQKGEHFKEIFWYDSFPKQIVKRLYAETDDQGNAPIRGSDLTWCMTIVNNTPNQTL